MGIIKIEVEDILTLKKSHPCGCRQWKVIRIGTDIGMKCIKCGHFVMIPRQKLENYSGNKPGRSHFKANRCCY